MKGTGVTYFPLGQLIFDQVLVIGLFDENLAVAEDEGFSIIFR